MTSVCGLPTVSVKELFADIEYYYNMKCVQHKKLQSYDDTMFLVTSSDNERYIAKYYNTLLTSRVVLQSIVRVLTALHHFNVPKPILSTSNNLINCIDNNKDNIGCKTKCFLILFEYIDGDLLENKPMQPEFWKKLGRLVGVICAGIQGVDIGSFTRDFAWDALRTEEVLEKNREYFPAQDIPNLTLDTVIHKIRDVINRLAAGPYTKQFIHGDINEFNIVLTGDKDNIGIIDFNDLVVSYPVFELGHALAYMIQCQQCDIQVGRYIFEGYTEVQKMTEEEVNMLYDIIVARFTVSCTLGNVKVVKGEANAYVTECAHVNKIFLRNFVDIGREKFYCVLLGK